jgi:DNA-binding response OmpR family regulator
VSGQDAAAGEKSLPLPATPGTLDHVSTILVVEDEPGIAQLVEDYLEAAGFTVVLASSGRDAIAHARANAPALVVLDLGLPDRDGFDVTRDLRQFSDAPIVMLTARGDESDRVVGLELGADDYVVKPFSPKELVARIRAVLRRAERAATPADRLTALDVVVDLPRHRVTVGGRQVGLTATEFTLLRTLVREPGRVFTRGQLLDAVHGVSFESYERAIDAHVKNLRRKIEPQPGSSRYIQTVHGVGYRFADA